MFRVVGVLIGMIVSSVQNAHADVYEGVLDGIEFGSQALFDEAYEQDDMPL